MITEITSGNNRKFRHSLTGKLSFFNTSVTRPVRFEIVRKLEKIEIAGGGWTRFDIIFQYMQENMEEYPKAIIILINGYARIPDEKEVDGMPVLWLIIDCAMEPDWGKCIHIYSEMKG